MESYIALLRGINVSGHKKIKMTELRNAVDELGFTDVRTYIQSGNIVFRHPKTAPSKLSGQINGNIREAFGYEVPVITLLLSDLTSIAANNPFLSREDIDPSRLYIAFLDSSPEKEYVQELEAFDLSPDEFRITEKAVYLHIPIAVRNSKLNNNFIEQKLKVKATTRNLKTVEQLEKMASETSE